jgi:hypothetical protein
MSSGQQAKEERELFVHFAGIAAFGIDLSTIQSCRPPHPDIGCVAQGSPCAFELVELIDPEETRRVRRQIDAQSALLDACNALPKLQKRALRRRAGNAMLSITFVESASSLARKKVIPLVIECLTKIEPNFIGSVPSESWWGGVIQRMRLSRSQLIGPVFSVVSAGFYRNPMIIRVAEKFAKSYQSEAPIELLAYHHVHRPPLPRHLWEGPLEAYLRLNLHASRFRRVWVFDDHNRRVDLVYPPLSGPNVPTRQSANSRR